MPMSSACLKNLLRVLLISALLPLGALPAAPPAGQTITFGPISDKLTTDSVTLSATASSGLPVSFAVTSGLATLSGNVLTFSGAGSVTITASQDGDGMNPPATPVAQTFNVTKAPATLSLSRLVQIKTGTPRSASTTTTPAGLTVDLTYNASSTAPINGGSYAVTATINDAMYQGTSSATLHVLELSALGQAVLPGAPASLLNGTDFGDVMLGLPSTRVFTLSNPGTSEIALPGLSLLSLSGPRAGDFKFSALPPDRIAPGGQVSFEIRLQPSIPELGEALLNFNFDAAPQTIALSLRGFLPSLQAQSISFSPPRQVYLAQNVLSLSATASSGLPVAFRVVAGPATLAGNLLNLTGAGKVVVEASQAGNESFAAAAAQVRNVVVFANPSSLALVDLVHTYDGLPHSVRVTGVSDPASALVEYWVNKVWQSTAPTAAGNYAVRVTYASRWVYSTMVIQPAPLYVRAENKRRLVSESNPALTVVYDGFIGSDRIETVRLKPIVLGTTAVAGSPAGVYPITLSSGQVRPNYRLVYRGATLTVEGVNGSYEALLRDPDNGRHVGHLSVSVPASSQSFSASLRVGSELRPMAWSGGLVWSNARRSAGFTGSQVVDSKAWELTLTLTPFGEMTATLRRDSILLGTSGDGIKLQTETTAGTSRLQGGYTMLMLPQADLPAGHPSGLAWATAGIAGNGRLMLAGRLADNTNFTASAQCDVAQAPGYRLFVQPYNRINSLWSATLSMQNHPDQVGRLRAVSGDSRWVKASGAQDAAHRSGFALDLACGLEPWRTPLSTSTLAAALGLAVDGDLEVEHDSTGSAMDGSLPTVIRLAGRPEVISVITPAPNPSRWRMNVVPATGVFSGSYDLIDGLELRRVNFSGVLRQGPAGEAMIGGGFFLVPPRRVEATTEQTSRGLVLLRPSS